MAVRSNDLLLCFDGGDPFSSASVMRNDVSLGPYNQARTGSNKDRLLKIVSVGSDEDIDGNVQSIVDQINSFTDNQSNTIGQVCILGRSNGCSLALGVAARLLANDVPLTFVGVTDVTMFPDGRKPPIKGIGDLKPNKDPVDTSAKSPDSIEKRFGNFFLQPVPVGAVPVITLKTVIKASEGTVNHFQTKGNHMKYAPSVGRWIWFSDMVAGEVHGKIDGFENNGFDDVPGKSDIDLHVNVNKQQHWKDLANRASIALGKIP